jgi:hypothetical protein
MRLTFSWRYLLAFYALSEALSELHEQAHITTGRLLAGCYGPRNFNVWQSCAEHPPVPAWAAPLAGPLVSWLLFWGGLWLMRSQAASRRALGFSVLFAALPFARIFTAAMGGGDERMLATLSGLPAPRWVAIAATLLLCGVPIALAARRIANRRAWAWVLGFCVLPLPVVMQVKFKFMNGLLNAGVLAEPRWLGTPTLVLAYAAGMALAAFALRRWLAAIEFHPNALQQGEEKWLQPTGAS